MGQLIVSHLQLGQAENAEAEEAMERTMDHLVTFLRCHRNSIRDVILNGDCCCAQSAEEMARAAKQTARLIALLKSKDIAVTHLRGIDDTYATFRERAMFLCSFSDPWKDLRWEQIQGQVYRSEDGRVAVLPGFTFAPRLCTITAETAVHALTVLTGKIHARVRHIIERDLGIDTQNAKEQAARLRALCSNNHWTAELAATTGRQQARANRRRMRLLRALPLPAPHLIRQNLRTACAQVYEGMHLRACMHAFADMCKRSNTPMPETIALGTLPEAGFWNREELRTQLGLPNDAALPAHVVCTGWGSPRPPVRRIATFVAVFDEGGPVIHRSYHPDEPDVPFVRIAPRAKT